MTEILLGIGESIRHTFELTWWIFLPIILAVAVRNIYLIYVQDRYIKAIDWVLLEIKVPEDVLKTPKAMEQVFAAMYANYSHSITFLMRYLDGFVDYWYSFEIVGYAGGIHFYVFTARKMRNTVEATIYSQYPGAEIQEVPDYTELMPSVLPNETYDLWGTVLRLGRESAYPIRTYPYFEEAQEEKRLDPISAITEVMAGLKEGEILWYQIVICPSDSDVGNNWKEEGDEIIAKITGQSAAKKRGLIGDIGEFLKNLIWAAVEHPQWGEAKKEERGGFKILTPPEDEIVKAVGNKIAKLGFETNFRFIYIDRRDSFTTANATAVMGSIRQFNTQNLNVFRPDKTTLTLVTGWRATFLPLYQKLLLFSKKKKLFSDYKLRRLNSKMVGKYRPRGAKITTFNTEELATLYHFPTMLVGTPSLRRVEAKKGGPPVGLPTE